MLVVLVSLLTFAWYGTSVIQKLYLDKTANDLAARCQLLGTVLKTINLETNVAEADVACGCARPDLIPTTVLK